MAAMNFSLVQARKIRNAFRVFAMVALSTLAVESLLDQLTLQAFTAPFTNDFSVAVGQKQMQLDSSQLLAEHQSRLPFVDGIDGTSQAKKHPKTARAAGVSIFTRVIHAMGAGAVASVIQAALSAVGEPIVNRVLVKRMAVMDAIRDVSPMMMLNFFKTTLTTNFLKFPFFEAINAFLQCFPLSGAIRGWSARHRCWGLAPPLCTGGGLALSRLCWSCACHRPSCANREQRCARRPMQPSGR